MREIIRGCFLLLTMSVLQPLLVCGLQAAERTQPIRIGALTDSWGPHAGVVRLRDALKEHHNRRDVPDVK
jgi:hypothetical protein